MNEVFHKFSVKVSNFTGSPFSFIAALLIIILWLVTGSMFQYSDTWQLFINTGTTIITFLMVFLIQNTQNRDARAMQLKLDELVRSVKGARNMMLNIEDMSDSDLENLHEEFKKLHETYEKALKKRGKRV